MSIMGMRGSGRLLFCAGWWCLEDGSEGCRYIRRFLVLYMRAGLIDTEDGTKGA